MDVTYEQLLTKDSGIFVKWPKGWTHEAVKGYTQMNKERLVVALSKALGIQHEHHDVVGLIKLQSRPAFANSRSNGAKQSYAQVIIKH